MATASQITVSPVMQVIRVSLIIFNIVFLITGFCLFVIGIWATVELNRYAELPRPNNYDAVSIVLIVIGIVIVFVGVCGCCGAIKKHVFLLKMFALFLGIIIICELSVAIAGYAYRSKIQDALSDGLNTTMKAYKDDSIIRGAWDKMQENFDCCGNKNYSDWFNVMWYKSSQYNDYNTTVPKSCCKDMQLTDCNNPKNVHNHSRSVVEKYIYIEGCHGKITDFFRQKFSVLASAALSIAVIQFFSIVCAGCFWNHVQNKSKYELV